jgi:hypothetical protein
VNWSTAILLVVAGIHLGACVLQALKANWPMAINLFGLAIADTAFAFMAK